MEKIKQKLGMGDHNNRNDDSNLQDRSGSGGMGSNTTGQQQTFTGSNDNSQMGQGSALGGQSSGGLGGGQQQYAGVDARGSQDPTGLQSGNIGQSGALAMDSYGQQPGVTGGQSGGVTQGAGLTGERERHGHHHHHHGQQAQQGLSQGMNDGSFGSGAASGNMTGNVPQQSFQAQGQGSGLESGMNNPNTVGAGLRDGMNQMSSGDQGAAGSGIGGGNRY